MTPTLRVRLDGSAALKGASGTCGHVCVLLGMWVCCVHVFVLVCVLVGRCVCLCARVCACVHVYACVLAVSKVETPHHGSLTTGPPTEYLNTSGCMVPQCTV